MIHFLHLGTIINLDITAYDLQNSRYDWAVKQKKRLILANPISSYCPETLALFTDIYKWYFLMIK